MVPLEFADLEVLANVDHEAAEVATMADAWGGQASLADPGLMGESGDLFRAVAVNSALSMCLVSRDGRFQWVNPAICRFLGRDAEDLLSLGVSGHDGNFLVNGSVSIRTLNRKMDWHLPEEEASTLNGLVLEELGEIPSGKASLKIGRHILTVLEIKDNKIARVLVKPERLQLP